MRLSKMAYESTPYTCMLVGAGALAASFLWRAQRWSDLVAGFGLVALVTGLVLALKRRDYRIQKRHYGAEFDDNE